MLQERAQFHRRLESIKRACDEPLLIANADPMHDERAKQLRCGLCVMTFSALEDFIRSTTARALTEITPVTIPFSKLPEAFQKSATLTALNSLSTQIQYISKDVRLAFLAQEFKTLATVSDQHFRISKYAFVQSKSNVHGEEVQELLESLGVEKPWETMTRTAQRIGVASANPLKNAFTALSTARHSAAHDQSFDIPTGTLKDSLGSALAIGIAFDVVISTAIKHLNTCLARFNEVRPLRAGDIELRFICTSPSRGKFAVRKEPIAGKAFKTDPNIDNARAFAMNSLRGMGALVLHDSASRPTQWYSA